MGRARPPAQVGEDRRHEVELARAVDAALSRCGTPVAVPAGAAPDGSYDVAVAAVVAALDPAGTAAAEIETDEPASGAAPAVAATAAAFGTGADSAFAPFRPLPPLPPFVLNLVMLDGLEVVQEVQDLGHSVPLVAGKATIVRAYLKYRTAAEVRGELRVARSANGPWTIVPSVGTAQLDPARSGATPAQLRSRRTDLRFSLNFRLPDAVTGPGPLFLRMGAVTRTSGTRLPSIAGIQTRTITFRPPAALRVRLVRMSYRMGGQTFEPTATDAALFASWLRRAYPTGQLVISTGTATANPAAPFDASAINAQLIAMRAVDVATGTDARTHYYGMVADGGFFMRGLASGIPQTPAPGTVASGPTGPSTFGWDGDGSYGDWYGGHELGHTFGRYHAEFCGAAGGAPYPFPNGQLSGPDESFVGLDVGDPGLGLPLRLVGGAAAHDVMTYCSSQWLSSFTYDGIYQRLLAENALPAGPGTGGMAMVLGAHHEGAAGPAGMRVIGSINLTAGTGAIGAVLPAGSGGDELGGDELGGDDLGGDELGGDELGGDELGGDQLRADRPDGAPDGPDGRTPPDPGPGAGIGRLAIRLLDGDGAVVDERPAAFRPSSCQDPGEDVTGVLDATVPVPAGAATVEVLLDGAVLDHRPIGGPASTTGALAPGVAAAGLTPDGGRRLAWQVADAPDGQRYAVQLSADDGATWRTVAVDLARPEVELAAGELTGPAGGPVLARLVALTGPSAAVVSTDPVTPA